MWKCTKEVELEWFKQFGRVYGVFIGMKPVLTISDAKLIKQVLVKDFHLFVNRRDLPSYHNVWQHNLFFNTGSDWKRIRSITSPAFTTGKLRNMYSSTHGAINKLNNYIERLIDNNNGKFDIYPTMAGLTLDVIASTSFGIDVDTNNDNNAKNPFVHYGQNFFRTNLFDFVATATCSQ